MQEAYAFDINIDLINSYNVIKNNVNELVTILKEMETQYLQLLWKPIFAQNYRNISFAAQ